MDKIIVTLSGAESCKEEMGYWYEQLSNQGNIVLLNGYFSEDNSGFNYYNLYRINKSKYLVVVNPEGECVGETFQEIIYALERKIPVYFVHKSNRNWSVILSKLKLGWEVLSSASGLFVGKFGEQLGSDYGALCYGTVLRPCTDSCSVCIRECEHRDKSDTVWPPHAYRGIKG